MLPLMHGHAVVETERRNPRPEIRFELAVADDRRAKPFGAALAQDGHRVDQIGNAAVLDERTDRQHRARIMEGVGAVPERAEVHAAIDAVDVPVRARAGDGEELLPADLARHHHEFRLGHLVPKGPGIPGVVVDLASRDPEAVPDARHPLDFADDVDGRELGRVEVVDPAGGDMTRDPGRLRADDAGGRALHSGLAEKRARGDPRHRRRGAVNPGIRDRIPRRIEHEHVDPDPVTPELEDLVADEALRRLRESIEHVADRSSWPARDRALRHRSRPEGDAGEIGRGAPPLEDGD